MDKTPATGAAPQAPLATAEAHLPTDGGPTVQTADAAQPARRLSRGMRRALVVAVAVLALAVIGIACWEYLPGVYAWLTDAEAVRAYVADHAVLSRLAMVGINALQVLLAFLPGEPVELASGYAFGFWEGTLLCLVASAVASTAIFAAVRAWGWRVVGLFFDRGHLERFGWLKNVRKLELVMLIVFLIPGTPKDFLTYFAGLTRMRYLPVLAITTLGRIPSIVTSTMAASAFGDGNYAAAIAAVVVAGALIVAGGVAYKRLEAHERA